MDLLDNKKTLEIKEFPPTLAAAK